MIMKKLLVLSAMILAMPLAMMAQDDDMYFVPSKKNTVKEPKTVYYAGSDRNIDEYNRRGKFASKVVPMDSDIVAVDTVAGIYPETISLTDLLSNGYKIVKDDEDEDYRYSRMLDRWYVTILGSTELVHGDGTAHSGIIAIGDSTTLGSIHGMILGSTAQHTTVGIHTGIHSTSVGTVGMIHGITLGTTTGG